MRIDAHVHFTPPELKAKLGDFVEKEPYWGLLFSPPQGKSIQGWATAERMLADMDAAAIDKVVLVGEYWRQHESCVARNNQALALTKKWPDRIIAMTTIQPLAGVQALDELKRCLDGGLIGVGELNPYAQGYTLQTPTFLRLVEACITADVPLNLHVSEEIGGYYVGKSTTPLRHYYELACQFPELKLILAHWGGGLLFYEMMPRVRRRLQNVWYDTAASPLLYPTPRIFQTALNCIDHHKILYGSDYPLLIYPGKMAEPDMRPLAQAIDKLNLDPDIYADVMGRNAGRLFGLLPTEKRKDALNTADQRVVAPTQIDAQMAVALVVQTWPETQAIFEQHGIPWRDSTVPSWEPIVQAAVAQGHGPTAQKKLLNALNELIG